jgi:hypothetical protein
LVVRARLIAMAAVSAGLALIPASAAASHFKPCVRPGEPVPFDHYWLGQSFDGLGHTDSSYDCRRPSAEPGFVVRTDLTDYGYGDCEGSCASPVDVQTAPACDRWWGAYNFGAPGEPIRRPRLTKVLGVPAARAERGRQLDLYTGDVTITILAGSRAQATRAAHALRPASGPVRAATASLAQPVHGALRGRIDCGLSFRKLAVRGSAEQGDSRAVVLTKLPRPAFVDVELERWTGREWVWSDQAFYRAPRGTSHRSIRVRPGRFRATVTATDHVGRRTRVRTVHFSTSEGE